MLRVLPFKLQLRSLDVKIAEPDQNLRRVHGFRQMYNSEESAGSTDVVGKHRFGNLKTRNLMIWTGYACTQSQGLEISYDFTSLVIAICETYASEAILYVGFFVPWWNYVKATVFQVAITNFWYRNQRACFKFAQGTQFLSEAFACYNQRVRRLSCETQCFEMQNT